MEMDNTTLITAVIGFFILMTLFKFIIKIPIYLVTFGILGALAYGAYKYLMGM